MRKKYAIVWMILLVVSLAACTAKELAKNDMDAEKPFMSGYKDLKELPLDYQPEDAQQNGDVVSLHGKGYNIDKLEAFILNLEKKEPAMVRVTQYTVEGDAVIKDIYYDGSALLVKEDNTRDKWSATENRKIIVYKASNINVSKGDNGIQYNAILENGDTYPITWISSK